MVVVHIARHMSRLDKLVLAGLTAILLFIISTVRLHENLSCTTDATGQGLSCERVQTRLIVSSDQHLRIPDARTVVLQLSGHTTSSHNAVSSSVIEARDESGRRVVLLSVPEPNVVYAEDLEKALRDIDRSASRTVSFERDESRRMWILVPGLIGFAALYVLLLRFRNASRVAADASAGRNA
jgi:hypothetical protein